MNDATSIAVILALSVCIICFITALVLTMKKKEDDICRIEQAYSRLRDDYDYSMKTVADINGKYSNSLDDREKFLNEANVRIKKLELEIEAKNAEIERLNRRIAVVELPVDVSKITEVNHEEKET